MPFSMPVKVVCPHCETNYTISLDLHTLKYGSEVFEHRAFYCGESVRWDGNELVKADEV